ncbi:MAG: hypothetical protein ABFR90_11195 [Planctomycetota bacterium]
MRKSTLNKTCVLLFIIMLSAHALAKYDPNNFNPENAAHWYRKAFSSYEKPNETIDLHTYVFENMELTPEIAQYLKKQQPIVGLMTKAACIDYCDWEYGPYEDIWSLSEASLEPGSNSINAKACFRVFLADMYSTENENTPMKMLGQLQILFRFSKHLDGLNRDTVTYLSCFRIKSEIFEYFHDYIKRQANKMTSDELESFYKLLKKENTINFDDIFDEQLEFAQKALTKHTDQSIDDKTEKILNFKGPEGRKEYYKRNLRFYKEHIANLRVNTKNPLVLKALTSQIWDQGANECDLLYNKFGNYPDGFEPSEEDYQYLLKHSSSLFASMHSPPMFQIYEFKVSIDTHRSVSLTILKEKRGVR